MELVRKAYAKINLGLDVLRKRPDGYHEVKMIMQTIGLYDVLTFKSRQDDEIHIDTGHAKLPNNEDNLIYKAAKVLFEETGKTIGADITLEKNIPIAAGMAGGSTDGAAALVALNQMLGSPLSMEKLLEISVKVGADVPYCIMGGTALSEGIGEKLTPLPAPPKAHLVIAKPDIGVSTAFVYGNLHLDAVKSHPDIDGMAEALAKGNLEGIASRMGNVLETVTIPVYPIIETIKDICKEMGALNALMSGSGPTVFAVFTEEEKAKKAAEKIRERKLAKEVFVTGFIGKEELI